MSRGLVLATCIGVVLLAADDAHAFCRMTTAAPVQSGNAECNTDGVPLEWRRPCMSYAVDDSGSESLDIEEVVAAVDQSFATWMAVTCDGESTDLEVSPLENSNCQTAQFNESGPNVNTVAFLSPFVDADGDPYDPNAFAVTIVWHNRSTGEILDADILINEDLGPYARCPDSGCPGSNRPGAQGPVDLQSIVTHEAGHFFGIGHSADPEATMFAESSRTEVIKRTLAQDDIDALCTIYPPGSLTGDCDPRPIGGVGLDCTVPVSDNGGSGCSVAVGRSARQTWGWGLLALAAFTWLGRRRWHRWPGARP